MSIIRWFKHLQFYWCWRFSFQSTVYFTIQTRILYFFLVSILKGTLLEAEIHIYFPHFVYHKKITFWLYLWNPLILDQCIYYFCISMLQMKLLIIFNNCTQMIGLKIHDNSLASFELLKAEIWYISAWKEYIYIRKLTLKFFFLSIVQYMYFFHLFR